eukprot:c28943_g1_i1 orf=108-1127(-)
MRGRAAQPGTGRGGLTNLMMVMISCLACFYVAGRLWQDTERRWILIKLLNRSGKGKGWRTISAYEKLEALGCKDKENRLAELEMEVAASRSQGFLQKDMTTRNTTFNSRRFLAVIGINTEFGNRMRRDSIRRKWMSPGGALENLAEGEGIVIRFVIGRSANRGDSSDRLIDAEHKKMNDFLILEKHIEASEESVNKAKNFFSSAVTLWDADFYIKVDDDAFINIDELRKLLASNRDKPRVYIGCMKSGNVVTEVDQRWYEQDWWKFGEGKSYFRHAGGQMYVLSRLLARYVYANRDILHNYAHEDISVGSWMLGLHVEYIDDRRFCCSSPPIGAICKNM